MKPDVVVLQKNNQLFVANHQLDVYNWNKIIENLGRELTFFKREMEYSYSKTKLRFVEKKLFDVKQSEKVSGLKILTCPSGFKSKILNFLNNKNLKYQMKNEGPNTNLLFKDWKAVEKAFKFYPKQRECLEEIEKADCGIIYAVTGFGKMVLLTMTTILFPNAVIDVVVRSRNLAEKLYEFLKPYHPKQSVGLVNGNSKKIGRITVFTGASLHKGRHSEADLLLCDEAHELITDVTSKNINSYKKAKRFAFTATPKGRLDNADLRMEAFFGKVIFELKYKDAVDLGLVVPIKVIWNTVESNNDRYVGLSGIKKERFGIWRNDERNKIIAQIANSYPDETQIQILVKTVEHGLFLKQLLPDFTLVFDSVNKSNKKRFINMGLAEEDELDIPLEQQYQMRRDFESNKLKKVITTRIWATGIDARNLSVLIRADASASQILAIQSSGRLSRKSTDPNVDKKFGIVHDFIDKFDPVFYRRSMSRRSYYESMGWEQILEERKQDDDIPIST